MMRRIALVVGVAAVVLACGQASFGQGFQGGLRGAIRDAGGGVPGAAITLTNENTSLTRATITNGEGEYAFAAVEPGTYRVKVSLAGFKTIERSACTRRHAELPHPRPGAGGGFDRGIDHCVRADPAHRDCQRLARHLDSTGRLSRRCPRRDAPRS